MQSCRYIFFTVLISLLICTAKAQTGIIDSLKSKLRTAGNSQHKLQALLALCEEHQSLNKDSLDIYARDARELAQKSGTGRDKSLAELAMANSYFRWGWIDSALAIIEPELKNNPVNDPATRDIYFRLARQKAMCYGGHSSFPEALTILYQMLREAETYKDTLAYSSTCNTIGSIAIARDKPREALVWIAKARQAIEKGGYQQVLAAAYLNTAYAYTLLGATDSAELFIRKALPICRQIENLNLLATALRIKSNIDISKVRYKEAETALQEMIDIRKRTNNVSTQVDDNLQLADFYAETGQLDKAIQLCLDNIHTGDLYETNENAGKTLANSSNIRMLYYEALAKYYKAAKKYPEYQQTLEQLISTKDSFYVANSAQAIAELQTQYEVQKKETVIATQKLDLLKRKYVFYGLLALIAIALTSAFFIFRSYRRKQKLKMQQALEAVNDAEENERKRIAADLHDNLGAQANAMLYGTEQLQQLQPTEPALINNLHNTARDMLQSLRETVWAMKHSDAKGTDIWLRIINFSKHLGLIFKNIKISTEGDAPQQMVLSSAHALHIILIVQEAINNAVRHAAPDKITVQSSFTDNEWILYVSDNGTGFDSEKVMKKQEGFGLVNMQERAMAAGFRLSMEGGPGKGTGIRLTIKITTT